MKSCTPIPTVYDTETEGEPPQCMVCNGEIHIIDTVTERTDATTGDFGRVHRACTAEGVRRWNRENRPQETPLAADRAEWSWSSCLP